MKPIERNGLIAAAVMIAGASFFAYRRKQAVTALRFLFRGVKVDTRNILSPKFLLSIGVQNPTNHSITINSIVGDLNVNNKFVGSVSSFAKTNLAGNSESTLPVTVEPNLVSVASNILQMIRQKSKIGNMEFSFIGTVQADSVAFPIDIKYSLK